jgi:hypothetical protein
MVYSEYITSEAWRALRLNALIRDKFQCVFCQDDAEHVHHTKYPPRGSWHLDSVENLQSVCADCHSKLHADKRMKIAVKLNQLCHSDTPKLVDPSNGFGYVIHDGLIYSSIKDVVNLIASFSPHDFDRGHFEHVLEVESRQHYEYKLKTTGTCEWAATYKNPTGKETLIFTVGGLMTSTASRRERIKIKAESGRIPEIDKRTLVILEGIEDVGRKMIDKYLSELLVKSIPNSKQTIEQFGAIASNDNRELTKAMTILANAVAVQTHQIGSMHTRLDVIESRINSSARAAPQLAAPVDRHALMSCADYLVKVDVNPLTPSRKFKQNLAARLGLVAGKRYGAAAHKELQVLESGLTVDASKRPIWQWDEAWKSVRSEEES